MANGRKIGQQHGALARDASCGDCTITIQQAIHHTRLFPASNDPQNAPGAVENRISESHPAPALIWAAQRHIRVVDLQHRITGYERRCMSIRAEPEVNDIKNWRLSGNASQSRGVSTGSRFQVGRLYWHGIKLIWRERTASQQVLAEMSDIPICVPGGRHTLINLDEMHGPPRNEGVGEPAQHQPRSVDAAHRHDE